MRRLDTCRGAVAPRRVLGELGPARSPARPGRYLHRTRETGTRGVCLRVNRAERGVELVAHGAEAPGPRVAVQ
jgi:hypothetical protein